MYRQQHLKSSIFGEAPRNEAPRNVAAMQQP